MTVRSVGRTMLVSRGRLAGQREIEKGDIGLSGRAYVPLNENYVLNTPL